MSCDSNVYSLSEVSWKLQWMYATSADTEQSAQFCRMTWVYNGCKYPKLSYPEAMLIKTYDWAWGNKTFLILNSAEQAIFPANKY